MTSVDALDRLRTVLHELKAAGADGFEGLCANALARFSGLTMRLARSGLQFGRDASSTSSPTFAISLECKRYDDALTLEDLAGKVTLAIHELGDVIDLWAVGATSEVGDVTEKKLSALLEEQGITLLLLDWCARPLPPLSVLLAATTEATVQWFEKHQPAVDRVVLAADLDAVASDPAFPASCSALRDAVTASEVGLDALRLKAAEWARSRLSDERLSRAAFNQRIVPAEPHRPAIHRKVLVDKATEVFNAAFASGAVVTVLGREGTGKTWLVAQWWETHGDPPILIFVAGRRGDLLDAGDATGSLAALLAQQHNRVTIGKWKRRLLRWRAAEVAPSPRFVIVLDGLNERTGFAWADIIASLSLEVTILGGLLVVTTRETYWRRDVLYRLPRSVKTAPLLVPEYDDGELNDILKAHLKRQPELPAAVRSFVRNPRVCAVAIDLLDQLSVTSQELSIDRLLLEYWRSRVAERGDGIAHSVEDFHRLLRNHARAWQRSPGETFERDEWAEHSGAAKRLGIASVKHDLAEIEEGRFMTPVAGLDSVYEFRAEALPFALALLVVDDLKSAIRRGEQPEQILDSLLDPVRGFDRIASVLAASTCLACQDDAFPELGRRALLHAWFTLQNIEPGAFESMAANVPSRPHTFLDYAELSDGGLGTRRESSLTGLLVWTRRHPGVWEALVERLPRWLSRWTRNENRLPPGVDGEAMQQKRDERIQSNLEALSPAELAVFRGFTNEVGSHAELTLDQTTAILIARQPQVAFAAGLVGWAMAQSIALDMSNGGNEFAWTIRLNAIDFLEVHRAVHAYIDDLRSICTSAQMRRALGHTLRLLGDRNSADMAEEFGELKKNQTWKRVGSFCETDPYDPAAVAGSNIANALHVLCKHPSADIWSSMGTTMADYDFEGAIPALARFEFASLAAKLAEMVGEVDRRSGMPLRQMSWHLPGLSPVLDEDSINAMQRALANLISGRSSVAQEDYFFVVLQLASGILPHLTAERQADLLLSLPEGMPAYHKLQHALRPLTSDQLEARLSSAATAPSKGPLSRVLISATAPDTVLSERSREIVLNALFGSDRNCVELAGAVIARCNDRDLYTALLERPELSAHPVGGGDSTFPIDRALAGAVVTLRLDHSLELVAPRFMGWVFSKLGGSASGQFKKVIGEAIDRLIAPVGAQAPKEGTFTQFSSDDGLDVLVSCLDTSRTSEITDPADFVRQANDLEGGARLFAERQRSLIHNWIEYSAALSSEGANAATMVPPRNALQTSAVSDPRRSEEWLREIVSVSDERALAHVRSIGLSIAAAHMPIDDILAARAFRHLRDRPVLTEIRVSPSLAPFYEVCLFNGAAGDQVAALRSDIFEDALDDAGIESATAAAEAGGAGEWLEGHIDLLLASDVPGRVAKGLTIVSFRIPNVHSDTVLGRDWGTGFLGDVAKAALKSYKRARWAQHWLTVAAAAPSAPDCWRWTFLAEGLADRRLLIEYENTTKNSPWFHRYGGEFSERLRAAVAKRTEKRRKRLCGLPAPSDGLVMMLRDRD